MTTDAARPVVFGRLARAEWTKLRTVTSTMWSLAVLVTVTPTLTFLLSFVISRQWGKTAASSRAQILADPTSTILGTGFQLGQLAICVLGVMIMATEYSTGMIRASLLAVPKRTPMLAAKAVVFAALVFVVGEIVAFPSFFLGAAALHSHAPVSIGDPGVLRAVFGAGLYLTILGLFSLAIGAIVRHTAGAITAVIGGVLVLFPLAKLLPGSVGEHIAAYLPSESGQLIAHTHQAKADLLSPWQGLGVFCVWTALLLAIATYLLQRRDA